MSGYYSDELRFRIDNGQCYVDSIPSLEPSYASLLVSGQPSVEPTYHNSSNSTSGGVYITLWDLFGDTWNGAQWHLEGPNGHIESYSPVLDQSPYNVYIHDLSNKSAQEGLYYMTVQTPDESMPAEWWEVSAINH